MILPAIEVQPAVQAAGKQGTQSAAGTSEDTFSAAFGQSLRETAQGQSVPTGNEVDAKTPDTTSGKAVSGQAGSGQAGSGQVPTALAAEISGRVAEATAQAAKQTASQAAAGTVAAVTKAPAILLKATGASVVDVAKSSAGAATEAVEKGLSLTEPPAIVSGTTSARVTTESAGKSNLIKASNKDEKLVAAGSDVAKSNAASAGVAAAGARAAGLVNGASTVAAGKAAAINQTPEAAVAAGASAGKVTAAPVAILAGAVKPDAETLFALNSEPKSTAVKSGAGLGDTATALKATDSLTSAGTAQAGKIAPAPAIPDGKQVQTLAGAASTQLQSAAGAASAAASGGALSGVSAGAIQAKTPVTAKAVSAHVAASSGTKVQGAKSGVSGAGAAVAGGKGTAIETSISQASAAEGVLLQRGTGDPAVQTAALEVPAASTATSATPSAATVAAGLASSLASRFAMLGVPIAQAEQAQGDAIKPGADAKTGSKATGTAPGLEPDAKSGVAKAASAVSSNGVATAPVAVHAGATQVGAASVQAIAATHVLPAAVPANSGASTKSSVHSVQSAGNSVQAASARPAAAASVQPPVAIEDKAVVAGAAVTVERPVVEGGPTADSGQQAAGLNAGQSAGSGLSRTGPTSPATVASTPAQGTAQAASTAASPTFVEVAATAGIHAASTPAGAPSVANGAIAAPTGAIAAGHSAAVAGVAAGPGAAGPNGTGTSGAGSVSSTLSGVGGAARSEQATAAEPHRTLVATPNTLEVGVPDGTQGWLRIRAEVGDQGQVNASLAAASGASQEMLHRELPALNAYLHSEQMAVTATVSDRSFSQGGGGQTLSGGGDTSGAGAGTMPQGGTSGGQQTDAGRQGTAAASSVQSYSGTAGLSDATIANSTGAGYDGESGRWLNVRA